VQEIPRFAVYDYCGQYAVEFQDTIPQNVRNMIDSELYKISNYHSSYHIEEFIKKMFVSLVKSNYLRKSPITKTWTVGQIIKR
jgi:hypothetical protein